MSEPLGIELIDAKLAEARNLRFDSSTQGDTKQTQHWSEVIDALLDLRGEACAE